MSNAWVTCPSVGDNSAKAGLIPHEPARGKERFAEGGARVRLAGWWGKSLPRLRSVAGLRGRTATLGLRHGPDSYGRQQWGILGNGRKPDPATPRGGRRFSDRKLLSRRTKTVTVLLEEAPANSVPAAAVIRGGQALFGITAVSYTHLTLPTKRIV